MTLTTNEALRSRVLDLWAQGKSAAAVANEAGLGKIQDVYNIVATARSHQDPRATRRASNSHRREDDTLTVKIRLAELARVQLWGAAAVRGITPEQLVGKLIRIILEDKMIDAVMDDGK
jgi:hypothetical protein